MLIIDLLFPFVIAIMIGFIMGAITAFTIKKIASLEKKNKKIIQKLESSMNLHTNASLSPLNNNKTDELKGNNEELSEKIMSKQRKEADPQSNTQEANQSQKRKSKKAKTIESKIQPDPDFKPPESLDRKVEEGEWNVVKKKSAKKPK